MLRPLMLSLLTLLLLPLPAVAACARTLVTHTTLTADEARFDVLEARVEQALAQAGFCLLIEQRAASVPSRLRFLESGRIDLAWGLAHVPEREAFAWFSPALMQTEVRLYANQNAPISYLQWQTMNDALASKAKFIAPLAGFVAPDYPQWRQQIEREQRFVGFRFTREGLILLGLRRGDLLIAMTHDVRPSPVFQRGDVIELAPVLHSHPMHLLLSKKTISAEDKARIDAALQDDKTH